MRGPGLGQAVWAEVRCVLSNPAVVPRDLEAHSTQQVGPAEAVRLEREAAMLLERKRTVSAPREHWLP